ncbi:hypothetical protein [Devosia sp. 2618]|uniref:hypothetical protein n=1 Tax=Devosia sp. 2618 TaxID=3156454 RepID=UPI00339104EF
MVAFNFQPQFAAAIESGAKRQTIRRSARAKVGDRLQLYTGQRTKACRKLVDPDPICTMAHYIALRPDGITFGNASLFPSADEFARQDGFKDYADMHAWFTERYETAYFVGVVIGWEPS